MQGWETRHLARWQGVTIPDEDKRYSAPRCECREWSKVSNYEVGAPNCENLIPAAQYPLRRGTIRKTRARQDVVERRRREVRASTGSRMQRPLRRLRSFVEEPFCVLDRR